MSECGPRTQAHVRAVVRSRRLPTSACEVLRCPREAHPRPAPSTIYRAPAPLTERGKARRLESLNAFIACQCDHHHDASLRSICTDCGAVDENLSTELLTTLSSIAGKSGFAPMRHVIEVHGQCGTCGSAEGRE